MGFSFFTPLLRFWVQLSCRTGKEVGSSFVLADLEARPPLSLTVQFSSCIIAWDREFEPPCTGSPSEEPELRTDLLWW